MEEGIVVHEIVNVPEIVSLPFLRLENIQALHRILDQPEVRQSQARAAGHLSSLYPSPLSSGQWSSEGSLILSASHGILRTPMTPLPKRKFSTMRSGKRKAARAVSLPNLVDCKNCGAKKLPHIVCKACGK